MSNRTLAYSTYCSNTNCFCSIRVWLEKEATTKGFPSLVIVESEQKGETGREERREEREDRGERRGERKGKRG